MVQYAESIPRATRLETLFLRLSIILELELRNHIHRGELLEQQFAGVRDGNLGDVC